MSPVGRGSSIVKAASRFRHKHCLPALVSMRQHPSFAAPHGVSHLKLALAAESRSISWGSILRRAASLSPCRDSFRSSSSSTSSRQLHPIDCRQQWYFSQRGSQGRISGGGQLGSGPIDVVRMGWTCGKQDLLLGTSVMPAMAGVGRETV